MFYRFGKQGMRIVVNFILHFNILTQIRPGDAFHGMVMAMT